MPLLPVVGIIALIIGGFIIYKRRENTMYIN
jgi:LPXTG-motif cell wall-anchored protein